MDILNVLSEVLFIPDDMFPKSSLPHRLLAFA